MLSCFAIKTIEVGMGGAGFLTKPEQYELVYQKGKSWANRLLVMKALPNGLALSRCGFSVSKRIGKAVTRNRVKRLLREITRASPLKPGWDMVFIARVAVADAGYANTRKAVESLLAQARLVGEYEGSCLKAD